MVTPNITCNNCKKLPLNSHMFRDCQNMYCTCPCVNQLKSIWGNDALICTCGYMNKVRNSVGAGKWPVFFSEDCACLKPSEHLPDFIRSVPKKIRKGRN